MTPFARLDDMTDARQFTLTATHRFGVAMPYADTGWNAGKTSSMNS